VSGEVNEKALELELLAEQWRNMPRRCDENEEAAEGFYREQIMLCLKIYFSCGKAVRSSRSMRA
jgi:hypothetical protein